MDMLSMRRVAGGAACILGGMLIAVCASATQPADPSVPENSRSLPEVQVVASKLDRRTLNRVAIKFVESHAAVNPLIHQIGRWRMDLCPHVTGLAPAAAAFVSGRVEEVARSVGAPTHALGKQCAVNVEVVFTPEPQQLLNHIAKAHPGLLGSNRSVGDTTFSHAIQSWYVTGTRSVEGFRPMGDPQDETKFVGDGDSIAVALGTALSTSLVADGAHVDPQYGGGIVPFGRAGSYFSHGLTSEILHVFVIVDAAKVATDTLQSISDYIAMLALTRIGSLDACSELPSIVDLLSSGCGERQKPPALTDADTAYLKALYSSDLEANLNLEQGDMRDRMVKVIVGK
jgi:hypothetical protein